MSKKRYEIIYDIDKDIWNWFYGANYSDNGKQLTDKGCQKVLEKIVGLKKPEQATPILQPFLQAELGDKNSELNSFLDVMETEFAQKFALACKALEKITGQPMAVDKFIFYITTFPRMVAFFDEGIIFTYAKIDDELWGMPIDGFLHEGLHFQFDKYWRKNPSSPVAKLSENDYFVIKESLTVILDEDLKPIITLPDSSYPEFAEYRKMLHSHWRKHHDFNSLVEFGLKQLPNFT